MFIYIHVPFCASRCVYCDFYVELAKYGGQEAYVKAICNEFDKRLETADIKGKRVQTVYFGGGTPSLLNANQIDHILQTLNARVPFAHNVEITLEANPNAWADQPALYRKVGINRVSVGVQSLVDNELQKLSRAHRAHHVQDCLEDLMAAGFRNVSVDLMYGIPGQTLVSWQQTLNAFEALPVQHVSFYGLHVEESTPLATLVKHPSVYPMPSDDETVSMYEAGLTFFEAKGFRLYEFSNLAKSGCESKHNLNYWHNGDYLALGPGAHGYFNGVRYETVRNLYQYLEDPLSTDREYEPELQEQWETALMVGLRLTEGISVKTLEANYGFDFEASYGPVMARYPEYLWRREDRIGLTRRAIPVSNEILAEFIA